VRTLDADVGAKVRSLIRQSTQISNVDVVFKLSIDSSKELIGDKSIDRCLILQEDLVGVCPFVEHYDNF
jgi:hypothetical protein